MIGHETLLGWWEIRQIYRALTPANRLDGIVGFGVMRMAHSSSLTGATKQQE
jgi:hypothetical protein